MTGPKNSMQAVYYHSRTIDDILTELKSTREGLSEEEARGRLSSVGKNELQEKKRKPAWVMLLLQFRDFMIIILLIAALLAGLVGDVTDAIIILVIVVLNAVVGFIQEYKAERAIAALKKLTVTTARVLRSGQVQMISSEMVVPGDVVLLEAGNLVPADLRLEEAHSIRVDESALTGESVSVSKNADVLAGVNMPLGDRLNMAFKGTLVTNGRGKGVVVATGMRTELGKIAQLLQEEESKTPLGQRMAAFGKKLTTIIILICLVIFVVGWLQGEDVVRMLLLSTSLAVAAIPEALPALITVALARGAKRMASQNALVRQLPAVETLGSVSFICSDKTGTLTLNKMKVTRIHDAEDHLEHTDDSLLIMGMALNHDVKVKEQTELLGDSTEVAVVVKVLQHLGLDRYLHLQQQYPRVAELPFDSDRKCMTTIHKFQQQYLVLVKGATESLIDMLNSRKDKEQLGSLSESWATEGSRVLAFGYKLVDELPKTTSKELLESQLTWSGLIGITDPLREEVVAAIAECKHAGIKPVMITGDHPATATTIAKQIGIWEEGDEVLTGTMLQQLSDIEFEEHVDKISVYARVSPEQKLKIVKALQHKSYFVAMTGDGVNDAPSLRAANIGVAMGINGTDVSKEAAHMILLDDNFVTIVKAVKEGRRIYDNIRKFVKYIMTGNSAEIWTIFLAPLLGLSIPLLPIHILWINLVTDGLPGLALASERAEPDVMNRPPRPVNESLFAGGVGYHILWVGLLMAGLTLGTHAWSVHIGNAHWQTMVFTVLSLSQLAHVLAVRSERTFLYKQGIFSNLPLIGSVTLTFALQLMVIYLPFMNTIFRTQPLTLVELLICVGVAAILFHAVELEKWIKRRHRARRSDKK